MKKKEAAKKEKNKEVNKVVFSIVDQNIKGQPQKFSQRDRELN